MSDLIDRQAAIDAIRIFYADECALVDSIEEQLEKLPSAQPQRIQCKDCKYASPNTVYGCVLERFSLHDMDVRMYSEDYCSRAERRTDG